jgi:DNA-binding CsgD family transcriptional regulator/PAS domain-containing protein
MKHDEELSELIGGIYDATLDPSLWIGVLAGIADFVGGTTAGLLSKDTISKIGNVHYNFGVSEQYIRLYQETYWRFDPLAPLLFYPVEQVITISDVMSFEEQQESRFYREWVEPQGWCDAANVILEKSATGFSLLSVIRSARQGMVNAEMRRRMHLVAPHVRRAVLISRVIELKTTQADTFAATLDGLSAAMFLVDAEGRIVHANAAGHAMLDDGSFIRVVNGRLAPVNSDAAQTLKDVFAAADLDDNAVGTKGISVPLVAREGEQVLAHALPLCSGTRSDTGKTYHAAAALFVHKAPVDAPPPPEAIAKTYKLTPSELRVLLATVEVGGGRDVAEALGISENTVKTHLKRLYAKTGATRQADLVKLLARFSSPLVGGP